MDFRRFLNLFESIGQLDEDLGALSNLNAGNLINVFKQSRGSPNQPSFNTNWRGSSVIGQNSQQVNLGTVKSWKDLRKAAAKTPDLVGAIFYVDNTAFAAISFQNSDINLRAPTSEVLLAFDPSKLPAPAQEQPPEGLQGWELERWQQQQNNRIPGGTEQQKENYWSKKLETYTGKAVELRDLEPYIDKIISLFPDHTFTAVGIALDQQGIETATARKERARRDDQLARRADNSRYGRNYDLQQSLEKYKASKEFDSFSEPDQVLEFIADPENYSKNFVYKGKRYNYVLDDAKVSIPVQTLFSGTPFNFEARIRSISAGSYDSLYVKYRMENGTATPIEVR